MSEQDAPQRSGFWGSFGLGYGSLGLEEWSSREDGLSGNLSLGGTISDRFLLGVGTTGWTKEVDGARATLGTLTALARFYPDAHGGFFLTGGLGVANISVQVSGLGSVSDTGGGAVLGLGYDVEIGPSWSFSPYANVIGYSFDGGSADVFQFGVGMTYH